MGGHITAVAVQQCPKAFAAAQPICRLMADSEQFDFFLDFNVSAQQLALGAYPNPVDFVSYINSVVPGIIGGLEAVPGNLMFDSALFPTLPRSPDSSRSVQWRTWFRICRWGRRSNC